MSYCFTFGFQCGIWDNPTPQHLLYFMIPHFYQRSLIDTKICDINIEAHALVSQNGNFLDSSSVDPPTTPPLHPQTPTKYEQTKGKKTKNKLDRTNGGNYFNFQAGTVAVDYLNMTQNTMETFVDPFSIFGSISYNRAQESK